MGRVRLLKTAQKVAVLAGILPVLFACMPEPVPVDTALTAPAQFDTAAKGLEAPSIDTHWPDSFGSKELSGLIAQALDNNLDIAAAIARLQQAEAQTQQAQALLLPTLNGAGNASRSRSPATLRRESPPYNETISNSFSMGLSASYALDVWGRYRSAYAAQLAGQEANFYDQQAIELVTAVSVTTSYLTVLAAQDRLALTQDNIATASRILNAIRGRLQVGTASALDVAEQESILAGLKATTPALEQQIQQSRIQLAVLLGRVPEGFRLQGRGLKHLTVPQVQAGLPAHLLVRRPDIARAEASLRASQFNVQSARAALLPNISLTASGGLESLMLKNILSPHATFASGLAGVTEPVFDGGNLRAQLEGQTARQQELIATYRKTVLTALADVENALVAVQQSRKQELLQQEAVTASRRAYEISEERLRAGTIDIVTLLAVQQNLFQAQENLVQSRLARLQASLSLIQALGGGFVLPDTAPARLQFKHDLSADSGTKP